MSSKQFCPFKDLIDGIQRGYHKKKFTTHYACQNVDLKLILVVAISNGFIFSNSCFINEIYGSTLDLD